MRGRRASSSRAARAPQARPAPSRSSAGTSASSFAMFLTRLNSTASAWKSSDARIRCSASARRRARSGATSAPEVAARTTSTGEPALLEREAHALDRERERQPGRAPHPPLDRRTRSRASRQQRAEPISRSMPVSSGRSIRIRTLPCICRRRPNGSREPVARSPACEQTERTCRACRPATPPPTSPPPRRAAARDGGASASTPIGRYW